MEQKKTLWIVAATGVFLLVVLGAALILYSPAAKKNSSTSFYEKTISPSEGFVNPPETNNYQKAEISNGIAPLFGNGENSSIQDPSANDGNKEIAENTEVPQNDVLPSNENQNPVQSLKAENVTVISDNALVWGNSSVTTIDLNTLKSNTVSENVPVQNQVVPAKPSEIQKNYEEEKNQTEYKKAVAEKVPAKEKETVASKKTASISNVPAAKKATQTKKTVSSKSSSKTTVAPQKAATYWIQVGAYESKLSADADRSILENNKIPNEVFTYKDSKGKLFYRVRVGPYTTESEALYWQKRINAIDTFEKTKSYVVKN